MRKLFLFLPFLLLSVVTANALPLYITVEGAVNQSSATSGYSINDDVSAVFMIDKDQTGYRIDDSGNRINYSDYYYSRTGLTHKIDYYLSEYIGGDCLAVDPESSSGVSFHFASEDVRITTRYTQHYNGLNGNNDSAPPVNSANARLYRSSMSASSSFFEYNLNDQFMLYSRDGHDDYITANVVITALSDTNPLEAAPVPEPASMFLLGSGILCLVGVRKKRK